jgi:AcrR family transcriptional regulator
MSHPNIYHYFKDKQTLFVDAFLFGAQELMQRMEDSVRLNADQDPLAAAAETIISYLQENEHYFMMMTQFILEGELSPDCVHRLNQAMKSVLTNIDSVLRMAGATDNVRYLSHTFFACINGILITYRNYPGRDSQEVDRHMRTLASLLIQLLKDGILTGNYNALIPPGNRGMEGDDQPWFRGEGGEGPYGR